MNPDYKEIGKNIRLMRIRHGISQSELAQRLDVSQTHMSNLEHGRVSVSLRVLLRLAHFFKCSVDTLLGSVLQGHVVPEVNNDGYDIEDLALLLKVLKQKRVEVMQTKYERLPQFLIAAAFFMIIICIAAIR